MKDVKWLFWLFFKIHVCFKAIAKGKLLLMPQYDEVEGKRRKVSSPSMPTPTPSMFFLLTILYTAPTYYLNACKKTFIVLTDSSVASGNYVTTVLFSGAELGSLYCLSYQKFNWSNNFFKIYMYNKWKELEQLKTWAHSYLKLVC